MDGRLDSDLECDADNRERAQPAVAQYDIERCSHERRHRDLVENGFG
jgi:hypothetical protein